MKNKLRVVWICSVSNPQIRERIKFRKLSFLNFVRTLVGRSIGDSAQWNTNAINEFEKFNDIELHIISPFSNILGIQEFNINGIYYHFFHNEDDNIFSKIYNKLSKNRNKTFPRNSKTIAKIVENINPDIIHLICAENPHYSESVLHLNNRKPIIVSLQTLLKDPIVFNNYPSFHNEYRYRVITESKIINKVDYIATKSEHFKTIIRTEINDKAKFLNMSLAIGEELHLDNCEKTYDFVYFAVGISKAIDYAIEAFAIAKNKHPNITMLVVGGYSLSLMSELKKRMNELSIVDNIHFTNILPTHEDVLSEIRKARFALLPLKADLVSSTIREAMANGLPVITTITPVTPKLNEDRNCILLSEKGDFKAMADNMCLLLEDEDLAKEMQKNAAIFITEKYSNNALMNEWKENYFQIAQK